LVGKFLLEVEMDVVGDQPGVEDLNVDSVRRYGTMTPLEASERRLAGALESEGPSRTNVLFWFSPSSRSEAKIMELV
jgi:hypothetical protein